MHTRCTGVRARSPREPARAGAAEAVAAQVGLRMAPETVIDRLPGIAFNLTDTILTMQAQMKNRYRRPGLLLAILLSSEVLAETWHADPISGCAVFDADAPSTEVLISWSGNCDQNGHASGDGVLSWIDDGKLIGRYVGTMQGGMANSQGVLEIVAKAGGHDRFEGQFKDNEIDGYIVAKTAAGIRFEGRMSSVDLSGNGVVTTAAGDWYTGDLSHGKMNGKGHLIQANGEQYRGTFQNDLLEGVGEWLGANGDYYKGGFVAGQFSGEGRYEASDGDVYEGEFVAGEPSGPGRFTDASGRVIEGQFKAGWPDGEVDVVTSDGKRLLEVWSDGKLVSKGP